MAELPNRPTNGVHNPILVTIVLTATISILGTSGAWSLLTQDKPTRKEVNEQIASLKGDLKEGQALNRSEIEKLGRKLDELQRLILSNRGRQ